MPPFLEREEKDGFYEWWADNEPISSKKLAVAWAESEISRLEGVLEAHLYRVDTCPIIAEGKVCDYQEDQLEIWHRYYPETKED
jgi:hypothetical protein